MANKPWSTSYPVSQDTPGTEQPNLNNDSTPGANDGDVALDSHQEAIRDKVQALALKVGDDNNLPSGSQAAAIAALETGGGGVTLIKETDFTALTNKDLKATGPGTYVIDGLTWNSRETANGLIMDLLNGTGLRLFNTTTDTSLSAAARNAPRIDIFLKDMGLPADMKGVKAIKFWSMLASTNANQDFEAAHTGFYNEPFVTNIGQNINIRSVFRVTSGVQHWATRSVIDTFSEGHLSPAPNFGSGNDVACAVLTLASLEVGLFVGASVAGAFPAFSALIPAGAGDLAGVNRTTAEVNKDVMAAFLASTTSGSTSGDNESVWSRMKIERVSL